MIDRVNHWTSINLMRSSKILLLKKCETKNDIKINFYIDLFGNEPKQRQLQELGFGNISACLFPLKIYLGKLVNRRTDYEDPN